MFQNPGTYDALHAFGLYGQVQRIALYVNVWLGKKIQVKRPGIKTS